jgi:hypothetical protein
VLRLLRAIVLVGCICYLKHNLPHRRPTAVPHGDVSAWLLCHFVWLARLLVILLLFVKPVIPIDARRTLDAVKLTRCRPPPAIHTPAARRNSATDSGGQQHR